MAVAHLFNHPVLSTVLLTLAFLGLVAEVRSEGVGRAGLAGILALALFFASHLAEGAPTWSPVLAAAGVVVAWPALKDPLRSRARLGIAVTAAGAFAGLLQDAPDSLDFARALAVMASAVFLVVVVGLILWYRLPADTRPPPGRSVFFHRARDGDEAHPAGRMGLRGPALTPLRPQGLALLDGEVVEVATEGDWLQEGTEVEVVRNERSYPLVRPVRSGPGT